MRSPGPVDLLHRALDRGPRNELPFPEATAPLIATLDDPVWLVRTSPANALRRIKAVVAIPAPGRDPGSNVSNPRAESASDPSGLAVIGASSEDPDPDRRKLVHWAVRGGPDVPMGPTPER